jgi:hypothetical protein
LSDELSFVPSYTEIFSAACAYAVTVTPPIKPGRTVPAPAPGHSTQAASLVTPTITPAPVFASVSTTTSLSTTTQYVPIPAWSGSGDLLANYCATAAFSLYNGVSTVYWVPVVGCVDEKPDCCPYGSPVAVNAGATATVFTTAVTVPLQSSGQVSVPTSLAPSGGTNQAILDSCPGDYQLISGGCCPV